MRRARVLALAPVAIVACQGPANETRDQQVRVAPPSTEELSAPSKPSADDAPVRDPLTYLPPDARLVGQLHLRALLDSPDRRRGFVDGFASASPRLAAHVSAIEACLGGIEALESVTFGSPSAIAPVLVVRGEGIGTPSTLRCYVEHPGITWALGEDPSRFSLGGEQSFGLAAGPDTVLLSLDHPEGPLLDRIAGEGDSLLDRPEEGRPALDRETRQGPFWMSVRVDEAMRPQLADTPASSLRAARCRADLKGELARASCRFELDSQQAFSLAAALADPDGPTSIALAGAGIPTDSLQATASGESLTVSLNLPLSALPGRG